MTAGLLVGPSLSVSPLTVLLRDRIIRVYYEFVAFHEQACLWVPVETVRTTVTTISSFECRPRLEGRIVTLLTIVYINGWTAERRMTNERIERQLEGLPSR